ncbi:MAG: choice-of-anchor J domain-containing protein [Duncaniella sp.]|nr:choice-of-anchor J domain-containing protein [Duncaniella sp.]
MKKNLTRFFSLLLAALTALSISASPLTAKRATAKSAVKSEVTTTVTKAPANVKDKKAVKFNPKKSAKAGASVFKVLQKNANVRVKAPFKVGAKAASNVPQLLGTVIYSDEWAEGEEDEDAPIGLYSVPSSSSEEFNLMYEGVNGAYGAVVKDGVYYYCEVDLFMGYIYGIYYVGIDVESGEEVFFSDFDYYTYSMTYDPTSNTIYALAVIEDTWQLVKLSFDDFAVDMVPVGQIEDNGYFWQALACDSHGQLYAIPSTESEGSLLYKIDKNTAAVTKVGATGIDCPYSGDATFDLKTNTLYWTLSSIDETGNLAEVNTETGEATIVYHFPFNQQVVGLVTAPVAAADDAPAAATDLKVTFVEASLSGKVEFNAPATLYDGTEATGEVSYKVTANGEVVASGVTTFGAAVSEDVTLDAAGLYDFTVIMSNAAGDGPKANTTLYVGPDVPSGTRVTASVEGSNVTVSWNAVTTSVNGGYFDPAAVTYTVTRFPGKVVVAENITETTYTDEMEEPEELTSYYYEVVAVHAGISSAAGRSNVVTLGSINPPFTATFDDDLCGFTVIDANGDYKMWTQNVGRVRMGYNTSMAMDDWLITPPLKLQAGKRYDISADFGVENSKYPERVEVKIGKAATAEAMTTVLLEPTDLDNPISTDPLEWSTSFIPEEDGVYYVGIHGISDADCYYLYTDNFAISAPMALDGPAAVTDLSVVPDENGGKSAVITFTTPDKTLSGDAITALEKVELLRNDEVIKTWEAPAAGAQLTYTDELPDLGDYTYTVVSYNANGAGVKTSVTAFVGVDYPAAPANVKAFETANAGEVTVTWDAVTTTEAGKPLAASLVTYQVYGFDAYNTRMAVSDKISATSFTLQAVPAGEQEFVQYAVFAYTERGEGAGEISNFFAAGTPYDSFAVSSSSDLATYIMGTDETGGGKWGFYNSNLGVEAQDGDNSFLGMKVTAVDQYGEVFSGLISLESMVNPGISFYTYNLGLNEGTVSDLNELKIGVLERGKTEFEYIKTVIVNETGEVDNWNQVMADLSAYAGKTVQVSILATCHNATYTLIDNLKVGSVIPYELIASAINAPGKVKPGEDYNVVVTVTNDGSKPADKYSVELYVNDKLAETKECEALASGARNGVEFNLNMPVLATEPVTVYAKVVFAADENPANNTTETVTVTPVVSKLPAVADLAGASAENAVKLTWSEPDLTTGPGEAVTEDFEDATGFAAAYGDWTFVDLDKSPVGGFQGSDIPVISPGQTLGSFWVWDTDQAFKDNPTFESHSGTHYLFAMFRYDGEKVNDWAISPELDGSEQTISFYAKSYSEEYPETIKLWYSTGSKNPEDFVLVAEYKDLANDWTLYEFDVPEGAKHFAINSCAADAFMLMVDDVTYIPAGAVPNLQLKGYDVYRDGVKINEATVEECTFSDANVEDGKTYEYAVVAVYTQGLSAASNVVTVLYQASGIESIYGGALSISAGKNSIIVTGAAGQAVAVYAVDGKTVFSGQGEAKTVIPAQQGVYVVKAGKTVKKVLVK